MAWRRIARMRPQVPDPPSHESDAPHPVAALRRAFKSIPANSRCDCRRVLQRALDLIPDDTTYTTSDVCSAEDCYRLAVIEDVYRVVKDNHSTSKYRSKFSTLFKKRTICCYRPSAAMEDMLSELQIRLDARLTASDYIPALSPPSPHSALSSPYSNTSHPSLEYTRVIASWMATIMQSLPLVSNFSCIPQALGWLAEGVQKRARTVEMSHDIKSWTLSYLNILSADLSPQVLSGITNLQQIIHTIESRNRVSRFFLTGQDQQLLADGAVQLERATLTQILAEMIYIRRMVFSSIATVFFPMTETCPHGCWGGCMVLQWRLACMLHSQRQCDATVRTLFEAWTEMSFPTSSGPEGLTGPSTREAVVEKSCCTGLLCVGKRL